MTLLSDRTLDTTNGLLARPGVSVVIPAYNYARYLPEAIQSVLNQTYSDFELLVVDDGSTDETPSVLAAIQDPRMRVIRQKNAGLSAARNTGIINAAMPFVGFLDADDRWSPDFLASVMARFEELGGEFAAVATATNRIDANGILMPPPKRNLAKSGELSVRDFITRNRPLSSSVVIRRSVFDQTGLFDCSLRSSEDRDMWIRITATKRFWYDAEPRAVIRRHGVNMSKHAVRMKENSRAVLRKAWRNRAAPHWDVGFWLQAFSVHYFQIAWTHFDAGLRARAFLYLMLSCVLWPIFAEPSRFSEPSLFRVRAFVHFCLRSLKPHPQK